MKLHAALSLALGLGALTSFAVLGSACTADDSNEESSNDEFRAADGAEGAPCFTKEQCNAGLACKPKSSAPPPGAVGLPMPPKSDAGSGPPPGAVGLPMPPKSEAGGPPGAVGLPIKPSMTCQKPAAGEEGGRCNPSLTCQPGLTCDYNGSATPGGPPPGAVGLPVQPSGPPSGAVGLPVPPDGVCKPKPNGPPPGAVGMPIHP
jgi:hypothetical protein